MHHATTSSTTTSNNTNPRRPAPAVASSPGSNLLLNRRLGLAAGLATCAAAALAVRYKRAAMSRNDLAQRDAGTFYVSVDRSGGGI